MSITGSVGVIKGQEVLPDGSTLEEHGFTDGSTVNIVIEPDKEINLMLMLGPKEFTHKVSSSMRVHELKQKLIDGNIVGFKNFSLIISADDHDGVTDDVTLEDESLPLHLCGVGDNTNIRIIGENMQITLVTAWGQQWYKSFPRNTSMSQMKQRIRRFLCSDDDRGLDDIWLFVQRGESYKKLDEDETPIGSVMSDYDVIYLVEDKFFGRDEKFPDCCDPDFPVDYIDVEIGRVDFDWMISRPDSCYHRSDSDRSSDYIPILYFCFPLTSLENLKCTIGGELILLSNKRFRFRLYNARNKLIRNITIFKFFLHCILLSLMF